MSGGVANNPNDPDGANQDSGQRICKAIDGRKKAGFRRRVVLVQKLINGVRAFDDLADECVSVHS
jgi:hypothetical protein